MPLPFLETLWVFNHVHSLRKLDRGSRHTTMRRTLGIDIRLISDESKKRHVARLEQALESTGLSDSGLSNNTSVRLFISCTWLAVIPFTSESVVYVWTLRTLPCHRCNVFGQELCRGYALVG